MEASMKTEDRRLRIEEGGWRREDGGGRMEEGKERCRGVSGRFCPDGATEGQRCGVLRRWRRKWRRMPQKGREFFAAFYTILRHTWAFLRVFWRIFFLWADAYQGGAPARERPWYRLVPLNQR